MSPLITILSITTHGLVVRLCREVRAVEPVCLNSDAGSTISNYGGLDKVLNISILIHKRGYK